MRVVNQQVPTPFRDIDFGTLLRPNVLEFARKGAELPFRAARPAAQLRRPARRDVDHGPRARRSPRGCRAACTRARASRTTCATVLSDPERTDDFRTLTPELYLVATDLDTCERIVFGADGLGRRADLDARCAPRPRCRWSTSPCAVGDRELIDGGIISTTNIDIAVDAGAKLVSSSTRSSPTSTTSPSGSRRVPGRGPSGSATWASRRSATRRSSCWPTSACTRWHEAVGDRLPRRRHHPHRARAQRRADVPDVDHGLRQPRRHRPPRLPVGDAEARLGLRRPAARSATATASRSRATRVRKVIKHFSAEKETTRAWRKILEQTTGALLRQSASEGGA